MLSTVFAQVVDRDLENTPIDGYGYTSVMPEVTCQRGGQLAFGHGSAPQRVLSRLIQQMSRWFSLVIRGRPSGLFLGLFGQISRSRADRRQRCTVS
ncbi:MAG: hypothetical protein ACR2P1_00005, partial [Pseudomonadales bacterium]